MILNLLGRNSLKTRVTLFTLVIFLLSLWSLAFYASRMLLEDMQRLLGEQQLSTASIAAADVNRELNRRMQALEAMAGKLASLMPGQAAGVQSFLDEQAVAQSLFNAGIVAFRTDGTAFASTAGLAGRMGDHGAEREAVAAALQGAAPTVGRPVPGQQAGAPAFAIAVPIRDGLGQVTGALAGVTEMGQSNFLNDITESRYGQSGGFLLIAPQYRLIVTATDKTRTMETLPPAGTSAALDRFVQRYEGTQIFVNPKGVEVLASVKRIPAADWTVATLLPTAEAFAPIVNMQRRMLLATLVLTLLAGGLTRWMLKRQLAPVFAAADTLAQREILLKRILDTSSVAIFVVDMQGVVRQANQRMATMFGCPIDALVGQEYVALVHPNERDQGRQKMQALLASKVTSVDVERLYWRTDHSTFWGHLTGQRFVDANGEERGLVGVIADITDRIRAEKYEAFRSSTLERLAADDPLPVVLDTIVRGVEQLQPEMWCSILLLDREGQHFVQGVAPSLPAFYNAALQGLAIGPGVGSCGTAAFTGERVIVADIASHPDWAPYRELAMRAGLAACWSQPIQASSGKVLGTLAMYHHQVHTPEAADIALIEQAAHLASIAIEKNTAAEVLRDSEQRYRTMIEWLPEAIGVHRNGKVIYVNPAAVKGFGATSAQELIDKPILELVHPDSRAFALERAQVVANSGLPVPLVEEKYLKMDGTAMDVEVQATRIVFDGKDANLIAVRDVTERKRAQEKLQLAAKVFTHAREAIMITTASGDIIDVNAAFTRITGYAREEVLGKNPRILSSGRQGKDYYAAMWHSLATQGFWYGEVWNRRKNGEVYASMQTISAVRGPQGELQQYVALFSDITATKEHEQQLERIAHFDALTSLPNRVLLADRLHQAMAQTLRSGQQTAVVFLDLDGFKAVNDTHGHDAGDQLLIALATRMKQALREGDTLARMGGDEFVAVLVGLTDLASCVPLLTRLLAAAAQPVQVGNISLQVSASLGVTFYPQADTVDADQLLRQADQAMYQAKLAGKNRYHVFDAEQDRSLRGHHESLDRIRHALAAHEFVLYYQPKVNMRTGAVIGAEALIRWQHPLQGLLSPAAFLPAIEDHPLAITIGEWVIDTALTQVELWHAAGLDLAVSLNVGARQLQQAEFVQRLQEILARHPQVQPTSLELEVLETSALEDIAGVSRVITTCRDMGVLFALDDFGTGYSSLTYLKRLPAALLKIDQSFVRDMLDDPDDLAILDGVIGLASAFRRDVIAEGVETIAHGTMLLQLGCELGQGYGIARPMPADALPEWVKGWTPDASWGQVPPMNRDALPLLFASVEHQAWVKAVERYLGGERDTPPELDPLRCHFGQWLAKEGLGSHGTPDFFTPLDALHRQAHSLAAELCDLRTQGQGVAALARLGELHSLQTALLAQLKPRA